MLAYQAGVKTIDENKEVPQTDKSGGQTGALALDTRRLIEEARKAIERANSMVRRRTLEAIRAYRDK